MNPTQFLPVSEFDPVADALASQTSVKLDVSSYRPSGAQPASASKVVNRLAIRLAALVASGDVPSGVESDSEASNHGPAIGNSETATEDCRGLDNASVGSCAEMLLREAVVVHGLGLWAESALPSSARDIIAQRLAIEVSCIVYEFAVSHHVHLRQLRPFELRPTVSPKDMSGTEANRENGNIPGRASTCRIWDSLFHARRHVLHSALAARHGSVSAAPIASLNAGPPLVLFVRQRLEQNVRVLPVSEEEHAPFPPSIDVNDWKDVVEGTGVFETVYIDCAASLRADVSAALKNGVKSQGLAPTLVVLDADSDSGLCGSLDVLRAVCDAYGAKLHVEGTALLMLGFENESNVVQEFDLSGCILAAHTALLDFGGWLGLNGMAAVALVESQRSDLGNSLSVAMSRRSSCPSSDLPRVQLARILALWWVLHRVDLRRLQRTINSAVVASVRLMDQLASCASIAFGQVVGSTPTVLLSCASVVKDAPAEASVNRAILRKLQETSDSMFVIALATVKYHSREWISFSPLSTALRFSILGCPTHKWNVDDLTRRLLELSFRVKLATAGAAAFSAFVKQSEHLEVMSAPSFGIAPLYYAAILLVPLGIVSANGAWRKQPEMVEQVEKYTCALAAALGALSDSGMEGVFYDASTGEGVPFVCIGPVVTSKSAHRFCATCPQALIGEHTDLDGEGNGTQEYISGRWECDVDIARDMGREAGSKIITLVSNVVDNLMNPVEPAVEDAMADGLLCQVFRGVEVNGVSGAVHDSLSSASHAAPESDSSSARGCAIVSTSHSAGLVADRSGLGEAESEIPNVIDMVGLESKSSVKPCDTHAPSKTKPPRGLWERLFGSDSDGSIGSIEEERAEVDYFRP